MSELVVTESTKMTLLIIFIYRCQLGVTHSDFLHVFILDLKITKYLVCLEIKQLSLPSQIWTKITNLDKTKLVIWDGQKCNF